MARNKIQQVQDLLKETQASLQATAEDATRLRDEKDELKNKLDLKEKELTRYRALEKYSISNRIDTTDAKYPFKSLCKVFWADGYVRLKLRLSDIHHDEITRRLSGRISDTKRLVQRSEIRNFSGRICWCLGLACDSQ